MANPTLSDFRTRFPELAGIGDAVVNNALDLVDTLLQESIWDAKDWPKAFLYYAAHFVVLFNMQAARGAVGASGASIPGMPTDMTTFVQSVTFGERTVRFGERKSTGAATANDTDIAGEELLGLTMYGQIYELLRGRNIIPVVVV